MVQKQTTPDWEDLRFALVLARAGTVRAAARSLDVSHSTVLRRIAALERRVGARLFERRPEGYALTAQGQDVCDTAHQLEDAVAALTRRVEGRDLRPEGPVTITLPDSFFPPLLPILRELTQSFPAVRVTADAGAGFRSLERREADIALRIVDEPPPDLVGVRVGFVSTAVYGSRAYLEGRSTRDLEGLDWVSFEAGSSMLFETWRARRLPSANVSLRVTSPWALRDAILAGLGVGILPRFAGDAEPGLRRVQALPRELGSTLWLLTHRDLRSTARVRVVRDFLAKRLGRMKARLSEPSA